LQLIDYAQLEVMEEHQAAMIMQTLVRFGAVALLASHAVTLTVRSASLLYRLA